MTAGDTTNSATGKFLPSDAGTSPAGQTTDPSERAVEILQGLVARRNGGETRPQQEQFAAAIAAAIANRHHFIGQAGTGVGKTIGYMVPAILSGQRVIVSTATKQLGRQITQVDMPVLAEAIPELGGPKFKYALLSGRNNYACLSKIDTLTSLDDDAPIEQEDGLFDLPSAQPRTPRAPSAADLNGVNVLLKWVQSTKTGEREDAPAVTDRAWDEVSTDSAGCPGSSACPFGQECFAERARDRARVADVVITNHALLAQDLRSPSPVMGEWDVAIMDEAHDVEDYLSNAWGYELHPQAAVKQIAQAARKLPTGSKYEPPKAAAKSAVDHFDALTEALADVDPGLLPELPENIIELLNGIESRLESVATILDLTSEGDDVSQEEGAARKAAAGKLNSIREAVSAITTADSDSVRWLEAGTDRRPPCLRVAPLWIGPALMAYLGDRTLIAVSATLTVAGSFTPAVRTFGLDQNRPGPTPASDPLPPREFDTLDVGTPFDYPRQVMLYVPRPGTFPEPVGKDRQAHADAILPAYEALARAAGGRTLALSTTTFGSRRIAEHLRNTLPTTVLLQGEAPAGQVVNDFSAEETATLCATMGMWHGVDVPGPSLTVVVMDKIPFDPVDDPLMSARRDAAEKDGRNGFAEIYVNRAAIKLAQGFGRLCRSTTDRGVVAILDPRLRTKSYGKQLLGSLPTIKVWDDLTAIEGALTRLTGGNLENPATNDSASPTGDSHRAAHRTPKDGLTRARKAAPSKRTTRALGKPSSKRGT